MAASDRETTSFSDARPGRAVRWSGPLANSVAASIFLLVAVAVGWFIHRFAVNLIYYDQWKDVALVRHAHDGSLTLGDLWAQHNENRILFPNLVVLALASTTHYDVVIEDALSGVLWCLAVLLIVLAHKRRSPNIPWILYCPVALVLLSFLPLGNTLFGFNLTWFMVMACMASAVFLLDRPDLTWPWMAAAVAFAVVGSYSSLQGLLIWPAGLVLLWFRQRRRPLMLAWLASGAIVTTLYFLGFDFKSSHGSASSVLHHPATALEFFFSTIGNVFGLPAGHAPSREPTLLLGLALFLVAIYAVVHVCSSTRSGGGPIGVALMMFGFFFVLTIVIGRIQLGLANTTRYSVFTLTLWTGAYLALLSPSGDGSGRDALRGAGRPDPMRRAPRLGACREPDGSPPVRHRRSRLLIVVWSVLATLLLVQVPRAFAHGYRSGEAWHAAELNSVDVAANIDKAPDTLVERWLGNYPPSYVRGLVPFAQSQRLGPFGSLLAAQDARTGLDPTLLVSLLRPLAGSSLSGTVLLDAGAQFQGGRATVGIRVTGAPGYRASLGTGRQTIIGWLAHWDTSSVVNGIYELYALLEQPGRPLVTSVPVVVIVRNGP